MSYITLVGPLDFSNLVTLITLNLKLGFFAPAIAFISTPIFRVFVMETQQVRYFVTVCDELSFTRAAQKCGVKQPSISEAIKRMERDVGGDLFLRTSPLQLTPLGSQLLPVCLQINRLVEEAQAITFSQQNSPSAESYRKDSAMSALTARLFPHASEASLSDIDTFVQIAIFCGIGLLLSLSVLILDQHVSGEWF